MIVIKKYQIKVKERLKRMTIHNRLIKKLRKEGKLLGLGHNTSKTYKKTG